MRKVLSAILGIAMIATLTITALASPDTAGINVTPTTYSSPDKSEYIFSEAQEEYVNGILFEAIDPDAFLEFDEPVGIPKEDLVKRVEKTDNEELSLVLKDDSFDGSIYNATSNVYSDRTSYTLNVTIEDSASLNGDISTADYIHGIFLGDTSAEDAIAQIIELGEANPDATIQYAMLDASGEYTMDPDEALAIQFTKCSDQIEGISDKILNVTTERKDAQVNVTVKGTWTVATASIINTLNIEDGGQVYGELIDMGNGILLLIPSESLVVWPYQD